MIRIYRADGVELLRVVVRDESRFTRTLMGEHNIRLRFDWTEAIPLPYGAYITWDDVRYRLYAPYMPTLREGVAEYDVAFHAPEIELSNYTCFYLSAGAMEAEWSLTGVLRQFAVELEANLRRIGSPLRVDMTQIPTTEAKPLTLQKESITSVLGKVAEAFEVEWWVAGSTLYIGKLPKGAELRAELGALAHSFTPQGEGNLLISRLYAFGANRNLRRDYRKDSEQGAMSRVAEPRLRLPANKPFVQGVAEGIEWVEYFDEVYPRYEGTLSAVSSRRSKDDTIYKMSDTQLRISKQYILEGQSLRCRFTSGALQGMDFDLAIVSDGYEIVPNDSYGQRLPAGQLVPQRGDKYVPYGFDISMVGAEYIQRAEAELLSKAEAWLRENNEDRRDVEMQTNPVFVYEAGVHLRFGQAMRLVDATPSGDKVGRITRLEYPLYCPQLMTCTIGNSKPLNKLEQVQAEAHKENQRTLAETKERTDEVLRFAERGFAEAEATTKALIATMGDKFGGEINPIAVRTMQLLAGDEGLQFAFVRSATDRRAVDLSLRYHRDNKTVEVRGTHHLMHYTLPNKVLGSARLTAALTLWTLPAFRSGAMNEADKPYYLYAVVDTPPASGAGRGAFVVTRDKRPLVRAEGGYNLLVGMLSAEDTEGVRSFVSLHGFTEVLPGRVTTDRIVSADGSTYFDLVRNEIGGNIRFKAGQTNEQYINTLFAPTLSNAQKVMQGELNTAKGELNKTIQGVESRLQEGQRQAISEVGTAIESKVNTKVQQAEQRWGESISTIQSEAGEANRKASEAKNTANNAQQTANTAQTTAQNAQAKAEQAEQEARKAKEHSDRLEYLRRVMHEGTTDIAGGLLLTNVLGIRDLEGRLRASLSGAVAEGLPAFRAGISDDGRDSSVAIYHNGTARFGQAHIDGATGQYSFLDGGAKYLRIGGVLNSLEELKRGSTHSTSLSQSLSLWCNYRQHGSPDSAVVQSRDFSLDSVGSIELSGELRISVQQRRGEGGDFGGESNIHIGLISQVNDGLASICLKRIEAGGREVLLYKAEELSESETERSYPIAYKGEGLPRGQYRLELRAFTSAERFEANYRGTAKLSSGVPTRDIALTGEGFNVFYGRERFFSLRQAEGEAFMTVRGEVDMFGVLVAGGMQVGSVTVQQNAYPIESWQSGYCKYPTTNAAHTTHRIDGNRTYFRIRHSIGHRRYSVSVTPSHSRYFPNVICIANDYVDIAFVNTEEVYWDKGVHAYSQLLYFTYTLIGEPKRI